MLLKKAMRKILNSCKKTTELIDIKAMTSLSFKNRVQLYLHKTMCKTCSAYEHQSKLIDSSVMRWIETKTKPNTESSQKRKKKILEDISKS